MYLGLGPMSEHWEFFPCQMGEGVGMVTYDHGISEVIDEIAASKSVRFIVPFKSPEPDGLPSEKDCDAIGAIEEQVDAFISAKSGAYVGRVAFDGRMLFYSYAEIEAESVSDFAKKLSTEHGYEVESDVRDDPEKEDYWRDLFPSAETWNFMQNMNVIQELDEAGDPLTATRRIDHWAFFETTKTREMFTKWATGQGFEIEKESEPSANSEGFGLQFHRADVPELSKINELTTTLREKAESLDGDYDGWESEIVAG